MERGVSWEGLPQWYRNEPPISPDDEFYLAAFYELRTERPLGFGALGPIPHSKIVEYAEREELDQDLAAYFLRTIRAMDIADLKAVNEGAAKPKRYGDSVQDRRRR
jgi:hypothetical protein